MPYGHSPGHTGISCLTPRGGLRSFYTHLWVGGWGWRGSQCAVGAWEAEVEKELGSKQFCPGDPGRRGQPAGREKALLSQGLPEVQAAVDAQKVCITHLGMAGQKEGEAGVYPVASGPVG